MKHRINPLGVCGYDHTHILEPLNKVNPSNYYHLRETWRQIGVRLVMTMPQTSLVDRIVTLAAGDRYGSRYGRDLRKGQNLMNALYELNPDLYKQITGTEADCFYQDKNIPKFWEVVKEHDSSSVSVP